ncbi:MAG TPA: hypothetical protein VGN65_02135 [Casimicrobiaceae bacterium]
MDWLAIRLHPMILDGAPPADVPGDVGPVDLWVEVVGPIVDALNVLARAIHETPDTLTGASIAVTGRGTLLLNQRAWILFAAALKTLPALVTKHSSRDESKPIRFLLIASSDVDLPTPRA